MLNPDAQIRVGMQGKVIGMTDAEWTATVNQNVAEWTMENREKMERLKGQREQMRQELCVQMENKATKQKLIAHADR